MARIRLNQVEQRCPSGPQHGYDVEPQAGPVRGWDAQPQAGPLRGRWSSRSTDFDDYSVADDLGQAVADVPLGAAGRFIGRAISRRVQRTVSERALPTPAARQQTMLREQIAIADRYPGLRACLGDNVIFLAGGSTVLPMPNLSAITLQQADVLAAQLSAG